MTTAFAVVCFLFLLLFYFRLFKLCLFEKILISLSPGIVGWRAFENRKQRRKGEVARESSLFTLPLPPPRPLPLPLSPLLQLSPPPLPLPGPRPRWLVLFFFFCLFLRGHRVVPVPDVVRPQVPKGGLAAFAAAAVADGARSGRRLHPSCDSGLEGLCGPGGGLGLGLCGGGSICCLVGGNLVSGICCNSWGVLPQRSLRRLSPRGGLLRGGGREEEERRRRRRRRRQGRRARKEQRLRLLPLFSRFLPACSRVRFHLCPGLRGQPGKGRRRRRKGRRGRQR